MFFRFEHAIRILNSQEKGETCIAADKTTPKKDVRSNIGKEVLLGSYIGIVHLRIRKLSEEQGKFQRKKNLFIGTQSSAIPTIMKKSIIFIPQKQKCLTSF